MKQIQNTGSVGNSNLLPKQNDTLSQRGEENRNKPKNINKYQGFKFKFNGFTRNPRI